MRRLRSLVVLAGTAAAAGTATAQRPPGLTDDERAAVEDLGQAFAVTLPRIPGWSRGRPVAYYDLGPAADTIPDVLVPVRGFGAAGTPRVSEAVVFTTLPSLPGYSGLWRVRYVALDRGVALHALRDHHALGALERAGQATVIPGPIVNLAVVPAGSTAEGRSGPLPRGWFKGAAVPFLELGEAFAWSAPILVPATAFTPDDGPAMLPGHGNLVDDVPDGSPAYPDLWDVHVAVVPAGAGPWRANAALVGEAQARGWRVIRPGELRNCPIIEIDGRPSRRRPLPFAVVSAP
jgi:hypothetical protein